MEFSIDNENHKLPGEGGSFLNNRYSTFLDTKAC